MNILVVGGSGFIGSNLVKKLLPDKHLLTIIDTNQSEITNFKKNKIEFQQLNASSKNCSKIFEIGCFDTVVYSAGVTFGDTQSKSTLDFDAFLNTLNLSVKFGVKKFIFLSTSYLNTYTNSTIFPLYNSHPEYDIYCSQKATCEHYCNLYSNLFNLKTTILRLPSVYGPNQNEHGEGGVIYQLMNSVLNRYHSKITVCGKDINLSYITDTVGTIASLISSNESGTYSQNGTIISYNQLVSKIQTFNTKHTIDISQAYDTTNLSGNTNRVVEISSNATSLDNGLSKTFTSISKNKVTTNKTSGENKKTSITTFKKIKPWIETIGLGAIVVYAKINLKTSFDFSLIYVLAIGTIYGLRQSLFAAIYCSLFFAFKNYYDVIFLYNISSYFLLAFISSFYSSTRNIELKHTTESYKNLEDIHQKLKINFQEAKQASSLLAEQVRFSENSFGKTYGTIKKLSAMTLDELMSEIPDVVSKLTGYNSITFYTLENSKNTFDLVSSTDSFFSIPEFDLKLTNETIARELLENDNVYFDKKDSLVFIPVTNTEMDSLAGLISIKEISSNNINLATEVNLKIVGEFISDYYTKASFQVDELNQFNIRRNA